MRSSGKLSRDISNSHGRCCQISWQHKLQRHLNHIIHIYIYHSCIKELGFMIIKNYTVKRKGQQTNSDLFYIILSLETLRQIAPFFLKKEESPNIYRTTCSQLDRRPRLRSQHRAAEPRSSACECRFRIPPASPISWTWLAKSRSLSGQNDEHFGCACFFRFPMGKKHIRLIVQCWKQQQKKFFEAGDTLFSCHQVARAVMWKKTDPQCTDWHHPNFWRKKTVVLNGCSKYNQTD